MLDPSPHTRTAATQSLDLTASPTLGQPRPGSHHARAHAAVDRPPDVSRSAVRQALAEEP
ncbi:hypothetical protein GCM10012275_51150 [Longimycelium tulufanense]|uniref:Uncharacterized protein n=1 Tax=Longimycelium tulufanense TaxID=907463 RepID=A0A8J3CG91_9PSEU|nr:hypothetical protein GCM10012275_51150 [Longimycelium tulufanense]